MLSHRLVGAAAQVAICQLAEGQTLYCPPGRLVWKTANVAVDARLTRPDRDALGGPVGLLQQALDVGRRLLAGGAGAQYFRAADGGGLVAVTGPLPGELRAVELPGGRGWYVDRDAFVGAEAGVELDPAGPAAAGDHRFAHVGGRGTLLLAGVGGLVELDPARYGGAVHVDPARVVGFQDGVAYAEPGTQGGRGAAATATMTGEGSVLLSSSTPASLAAAMGTARSEDSGPRGGLRQRSGE